MGTHVLRRWQRIIWASRRPTGWRAALLIHREYLRWHSRRGRAQVDLPRKRSLRIDVLSGKPSLGGLSQLEKHTKNSPRLQFEVSSVKLSSNALMAPYEMDPPAVSHRCGLFRLRQKSRAKLHSALAPLTHPSDTAQTSPPASSVQVAIQS